MIIFAVPNSERIGEFLDSFTIYYFDVSIKSSKFVYQLMKMLNMN